jgi:hypothetical protein
MARLFAATVCLLMWMPATDAAARDLHRVDQTEQNAFTTIHTASGQSATVATNAAGAFNGFLHWLEARNYRISTLGCYNYRNIRGTNRLSQHAFGRACDINQAGRNVVTRPFPRGTEQAARRFGLVSGAEWQHPDTGHFELARGPHPAEVAAANRSVGPMAALAMPPARAYPFKPCKSIGPECF